MEEAEKGNYEGALGFFNQAIALVPTRASGYNNRAQAYRLMGDIERKNKITTYDAYLN